MNDPSTGTGSGTGTGLEDLYPQYHNYYYMNYIHIHSNNTSNTCNN
ncbi:MAG: hypothetical protein LBT10_00060 [Methanobrevibacter sp.]|nr:hypothetical protein [Methanobrevibacter sp.]